MRNQFNSQLKELNTELIQMGGAIEKAILKATESLTEQNTDKAAEVLAIEEKINQCEKNIEALCFKLLLHQQPVAGDLRVISAALKMITDMERIGDQAADIAEISLQLAKDKLIKELVHIPQMAQAAIKMVNKSVEAFLNTDMALAQDVIKMDNVVDDLFTLIKDDLYQLMIADVNNYKQALDLLMVAKYYERIGDHAENIAEWVIYSITGEHKSM